MPQKFIRSLTGKTRTRKADIQLGIILAFIAGAINAGGFLAIGEYTSHMTGILSAVADYIALNKFYSALIALSFLLSFISGAAISAITINWTRSKNISSEYALTLMLEAILLLTFGICAANISDSLSINLVISLLCFIMGLQNAIITKISNAEIRTTHVTGISTDIGIEIGKCLYFRDPHNKMVIVSLNKLKLHLGLLFSFLSGGIAGALLFKNFGFIATIPLSLILALMASVPVIDDIRAFKK